MDQPRTVVLVEGESDRVALLTLAARQGRDLAAEGVEVVAMGGITNVRAHVARWSATGVPLAGLYDAPEEPQLRRGLRRAGLDVDGRDLADLGFHRCDVDLEDELLRALGTARAEAVIEVAGDGRSLGLLAQMPVQRDWSREAVLRRFLSSQGGRKARYARLFVEALDLDLVPAPLLAVLAVSGGPGSALDGLPSVGGPARAALELAGLTSLRRLDGVPRRDVLALHGVGPKAVRLLQEALEEHGRSLG